MVIRVIPVLGMPIINKGDKIAKLISEVVKNQDVAICNGDIIVVTHVIVSRAEGNTVNLDSINPSEFAKNFAAEHDKDPAVVEVVLREAKSIIRMREGSIITLTKHGFICANSGVDKSNVPGERNVTLLPVDADESARRIQEDIREIANADVAVIISDTHGRPLRDGEINVAIGVAGLTPILDHRGECDLFGYELKSKRTAIADELASAAELVIGQADESIPVAIIRGYPFLKTSKSSIKDMLRPLEKEFFI